MSRCDQIGLFLKGLGTYFRPKVAEIFGNFLACVLKNVTVKQKLLWLFFGQLLVQIGQLFLPPSVRWIQKFSNVCKSENSERDPRLFSIFFFLSLSLFLTLSHTLSTVRGNIEISQILMQLKINVI